MGSEGLSGAEDSAEVARILKAGEDQNERSPVVVAAEEVSPGPIGRLDEGGDGLRGFGGQRGVEEFAGQEQDFCFRRQREGFEQVLKALGDEDAGDAQAGTERFLKQIGAFNTGKDWCGKDWRTAAGVAG
jgi:hypothetical protein